MNAIDLVAVGEAPSGLAELRERLAHHWQLPCRIIPGILSPAFALHPQRQQVHSTAVLGRLDSYRSTQTWRVLGVTALDLYVPVLTFVFGEAQMDGPCAIVSTHRLRQEYFGLPADPSLFAERLLKEAVHELGHTLGLTHCDDHRCVMSASHGVEWIDLKGASFCPACAVAAGPVLTANHSAARMLP